MAFADDEPLFVRLLILAAVATAVAVPGVTGLLLKGGGDPKLAFVLLIFHKDVFGCFTLFFVLKPYFII